MKTWGFIIAGAGVIYLFIAFNMDVSVSTSSTFIPGVGRVGGGDVANLDLMARRQNHLIVASLVTMIGALLAMFGKDENSSIKAKSAEPMPSKPEKFDGERSLASDAYRLWLADAYSIERNQVFDRFVLDNETFDSLDEALNFADNLEREKIEAALNAKIAAEEHRAKEQRRIEEEKERLEAEWEERRPKVIVGITIAIAAIIGTFWLLKETPEEREMRLAQEGAAEAARLAEIQELFGVQIPESATNVGSAMVNENNDSWCHSGASHILLRFDTQLSEEEVKNWFTQSLGEGEPRWSFIDDSFDWKWNAEGKRYSLNSFSYNGQTDARLCMSK